MKFTFYILSISCLHKSLIYYKGTGHNKLNFVQRGPPLSGVGGLSKTPPISYILLTKFYWL